jgi:hypothetical protein
MPDFGQRHYELIASEIGIVRETELEHNGQTYVTDCLITRLVRDFQADNPRFSESKFRDWITKVCLEKHGYA